jgi:iron uptake system component EfeO
VLPHFAAVRGSKRAIFIAVAAVALVVGVASAVLVLAVPSGTSARSCSSYPTPGSLAGADATVPASLAARYSVFSAPQRAVDRLRPARVSALRASGLIMSATRFLGNAAFGGRIYLVPAEHLLAFRMAPPRCLSPGQRLIEREVRPLLRRQYREAALCFEVLYGNADTVGIQGCAPATGTPDVMLSTKGTPGFGLVPNGVSAVTVTYQTAPPRTVAVRRNAYAILAPSEKASPCGVQWLDPTGNVKKIAVGCSYLTVERHELSEYRAYVARKLSTLKAQIAALGAAIGSGNLAKAQSAWLTAHLAWLDIGEDDGAYGSFGALGGKIDGLAAGHRLGTADPAFTGFHRIEFDLWTKHDLRAAASDTGILGHLLTRLMKVPLSTYLPATPSGIGNWLLRPHEALEDALRDSLTADDDYGSGTDLASVTADAAAVQTLLGELEPVLAPVAPQLVGDARAQLKRLIGAVGESHPNKRGMSIKDLPIRQRQQVDADLGAALETLAPIPDLLTSTGLNSPAD